MNTIQCPVCTDSIEYDIETANGFVQCPCGNTVAVPKPAGQSDWRNPIHQGAYHNFLALDKFRTPALVPLLYVLGLLWVSYTAFQLLRVSVPYGLYYWLLAVISVRITCELLLVAFRILDKLGEIQKNTSQQ